MKKISVIIPVKDGKNYLAEALRGIREQNFDLEIIVVDDGSTDTTSLIAKENGCSVIRHNETKGQSVAKNTGLKSATGEFVLFHDHDDILCPQALSTLHQALIDHPEAAVVMAKTKDFISPDATNKNQPIKSEPYFGCLSGATLIRREIFEKIGMFSEKTSAGEMIDLTTRLEKHGLKIQRLDFISSMRRIHDTNYGKTHRKKEYQNYAQLLRERIKSKKALN